MPHRGQLGLTFTLTIFVAILNGWVNQPNYRGTFDIIWTNLVTIFISTYTMLCLNVPAATDTYLRRTFRRFLWMCLGILGPEFPLTYAAGLWSRAKHSVAAFRALGYDDWHMRHAFFADMGGFTLHPKDGPPFPLNATQLHWLVENRFVTYPRISRQDIEDKSKQDTFTKVITAFQVGYLIIQCVARAIQGLAITTLELNALAIVVCSLSEMTLDRPWSLTPLDFIDENGPGYSVNVQPFMKMPVIPANRPIQMIPNDRFPMNPYGIQEYFLCFATMVYTAIHVAGWSFDFPSHIERVLWRVSSLVLFGITVAFWVFETTASWTRLGRWKTIYLYIFNRSGLEEHWMRMSHQLPLPWEFASIAPLAFTYGLARFYLIAEAFAELRNLQGTAYVNVDWTYFIPHA
ncbi:hypothetical protein EDD37DRAFT_688987 [Exophiala viscosa]|uniref:uncharacterized protein n=1 Tax=Exophiala viscosa TaxID=2486360 RepID=UPI0021A103E9|nr:hypothetical protein EDD37DRAFT_688987 [Exophiala viscosa]